MLDRNCLAPHAVARWASATPDQVAVEQVGGPRLTYAELHEAALCWAAGLQRIGADAGHHVATMLPASVEAMLAMLAGGWLRAVEVPVNTAHRGRMLHYTLDHADAATVIVHADYLDRLAEVAGDLPALDRVVVVGADDPVGPALPVPVLTGDALLDGVEPATGLPGPEYHDLAALLFTSGTTGPSKAVRAPWGLIHQIWSWVPDDAIEPGEGLYCALPLFHNSGRSGFNTAMARGGRYVFRTTFSATNFWADVAATGSVAAALVGPMTSLLWSAPPRPDDADTPLRSIICGPMIPEMEDFERRFGVRIATCYGQTEVGCPLTTGWDHGPWTTCGRARDSWPWPEVRVVDEHDQPVGPGVIGELVVRAAEPWSMNVGYHAMPAETAEAWRNGWFHTGDAFRYDEDGWFTFVDRLRDSIRRRGENISSFEVEALVAEHPDVEEVAAIGVPDGHGGDEVMVVVRVGDPAAFDPAALLAFLEPRMPRFMLPRYVEVVEDFPRNATTMRIRKTDLRARGITEHTWDRDHARSP